MTQSEYNNLNILFVFNRMILSKYNASFGFGSNIGIDFSLLHLYVYSQLIISFENAWSILNFEFIY